MAEDLPEDLPDDMIATEEVAKDKRGSLMTEPESYERVVEGLKLAADGARHIARRHDPNAWNELALFLDALRRAVVKEAGFDRPQDETPSQQAWGGEGLSPFVALGRVTQGLKGAAAGARQIALGQRMDLRWNKWAEQFDRIRDHARNRMQKASPMRVDAGWKRNDTGLVVPTRLH